MALRVDFQVLASDVVQAKDHCVTLRQGWFHHAEQLEDLGMGLVGDSCRIVVD